MCLLKIKDDAAKRTSGYMTTFSGKKFYPLQPDPLEIDIEDIARGLSNSCRWGGQIRDFYSIAQHCVHVSYLCKPENALLGLLHDAAEAYIGDMIRPLKYLPEMSIYKTIEYGIENAIAKAFNLPTLHKPDDVEFADNIMLAKEAIALRDVVPAFANDILKNHGVTFDPEEFTLWTPNEAYTTFIVRFHELYKN
jgi:hypothetical protein